MFDQLASVRLVYLKKLLEHLRGAGEALQGLQAAESASPIGQPDAWNYPAFLLTIVVEEAGKVAGELAPTDNPPLRTVPDSDPGDPESNGGNTTLH